MAEYKVVVDNGIEETVLTIEAEDEDEARTIARGEIRGAVKSVVLSSELAGQALRDEAAELNIEGRSTMNADELREAILLARGQGDDPFGNGGQGAGDGRS